MAMANERGAIRNTIGEKTRCDPDTHSSRKPVVASGTAHDESANAETRVTSSRPDDPPQGSQLAPAIARLRSHSLGIAVEAAVQCILDSKLAMRLPSSVSLAAAGLLDAESSLDQ
jgi:hypothetical protein